MEQEKIKLKTKNAELELTADKSQSTILQLNSQIDALQAEKRTLFTSINDLKQKLDSSQGAQNTSYVQLVSVKSEHEILSKNLKTAQER